MLAAKHFDPVLGIDIHLVIPPTGTPLPIPHPHIGIVFDVMDYLLSFGSTIKVNGVPRATAGTAGKPIPHIPIGGPFSMPPGNEDEIFMGSTTVVADGAPFTFTALPVLSCQSVGMMAPIRAKKPKKSYGMVLPTTTVLPIPVGNPVMVGGPPTVDIMGLATAAGLATLGAAFKKMRKMQKGSKRMKKVSDAIHKKADNLMDKMGVPASARNRVHKSVCAVTGHPVDIASGKVFTDWIDFELPGPVPLSWERTWFSTSTYQGPLGHGWHHNYDWKLMEEGRAVAVMMQDGRRLAFPSLKEGEESFNRRERVTLFRDAQGYSLKQITGNLLRFAQADSAKISARESGITPTASARAQQEPQIHRLTAITDPTGEARISFHYNPLGHLTEIIDSGGRRIHLENDTEGRIRKIHLPHPDPERAGEYYCAVTYDYQDGDLVSMQDAMGNTMAYKYQNHLLYQETNYNGLNFYFKYDGADHHARCIHTWGDGGIYDHQLVYDDEQSTTIVQNSLGHKTIYYHDGALPHKVVDPLGAEVLTKYNEFGQIVCETDELGNKTCFDYDDRGNTIKIINPDGATVSLEFDGNDNPVKATDTLGGEWYWLYDEYGRVISNMDPLDRRTHYRYEGFKLISIINPVGKKTLLEYDFSHNPRTLTTPDGSVHEWKYNSHGYITTETDTRGNQRRLDYDLLGRVTQVNEPDGNIRSFSYDAEGNVRRATDKYHDVSFEYRGMGRMVSRSQSGSTVRFEYDTEEQLTGVINEHGYAYRFQLGPTGEILSEFGFDGLIRRYERDKAGLVRRVIRPEQRFSDYAYDAQGRVTEVVHYDGTKERFEYRLDGALIKAVNDNAEIVFERNSMGQITKEVRGDFWVSSAYDLMGRHVRTQSSFGADRQIERNVMGDVVGINTNDKFDTRFERDEMGLEVERSLPGGIKTRWVRDRLGRPYRHEVYKNSCLQTSNSYTWGFNNRLEKVIDSLNGVTVYHHDVFSNLISARYGDGIFDIRIPDALGNLFRNEKLSDREYGPSGQLLRMRQNNGFVHYEYDGEGNLISKIEPGQRQWRYQWNGSGMLSKVVRPDGKEVIFQYDALGRRLTKRFHDNTTHWAWDGNNLIHEWVETDTSLPVSSATKKMPITWWFEPGTFTPMAKQIGEDYYPIVVDHLGTPCAMYDQHGEKIWASETDVWGFSRSTKEDQNLCPHRWAGQYEDRETGLHYNLFRYYQPDSGQYISRDPIGLLGGINCYAYVKDPAVWVDPYGLDHKMVGKHIRGGKVLSNENYQSGSSKPGRLNQQQALNTHTERKFLNYIADDVQVGDLLEMEGSLDSCRPGCQPAIRSFVETHGVEAVYTTSSTGKEVKWKRFSHPKLMGTVLQQEFADGKLVREFRYWKKANERWARREIKGCK